MHALRIYLRSNRVDKNGQSVIYFIVNDQWFSTGIKCSADDWSAEATAILKTHPQYSIDAPKLMDKQHRAQTFISLLQLQKQPFNSKRFIECLKTGEFTDNPCFLKLIDEYCSSEDLSWARIKHYREFKNDIIALVVRPKLFDINFQFAKRLMLHLKTRKKNPNNENTIIRKMKQLKAVIHYCQNSGLITSDPLAMVKLKEIKGKKEHLSSQELKILEELYFAQTLPENLQTCLQYFLFGCYTGLRFSDIIKLNTTHYINNSIRISQQKTDKPVFVPLIPQAKKIICVQENRKLFKTFTNQPTNRYLKDIMTAAKIEKHITFHCSRHTFGTLSIYWGIPKEVVAEIMGVDMKTVNVYAKMLEEVKTREMEKWGSIAV